MTRTIALFPLAALLLAGCAVPEARLRSGLVRAGLPKPLSACMAERMVDRLSLKQLMRIADLPKAQGSESIDQFLHRVRALGDAEILGVTSSSAALCATGLAGQDHTADTNIIAIASQSQLH